MATLEGTLVEVGVRELRNHLSKFLDRVRAGEELIVTDRGKAIARMSPMNGETSYDRLIREGKIIPAKRPKGVLPPPIKTKGSVLEVLIEDRRW